MKKNGRLDAILVRRGWVTETQIASALEAQRRTGGRFGSVLVNQGVITETQLAEALAEGCDTLVTGGGAQSNHARLTAAAARRLGPLADGEGVEQRLRRVLVHAVAGVDDRGPASARPASITWPARCASCSAMPSAASSSSTTTFASSIACSVLITENFSIASKTRPLRRSPAVSISVMPRSRPNRRAATSSSNARLLSPIRQVPWPSCGTPSAKRRSLS